MASRFASFSENEILSMNKEALPKKHKNENIVWCNSIIVSYLISPTSYSKAKNQNTMPSLRKLSNTKITMKTMKHLMSYTALFQEQEEFNQPLRI